MPDLVLEVLPFGIGVFASPLPVIVGIVMLFTPRPRVTSAAYVATWVAGLTAVTVLLTLLAGSFEGDRGGGALGAWLRAGLGAVLLVVAIRTWAGRAAKSTPAWVGSLLEAGPREAVRYGLLMSAANPKELLMAGAVGLTVAGADAGSAASVGALLVFVVVGAASVTAPLLVFLLGGESSLQRLGAARDWLQRNSVAVASGVLGALGVWLVVGALVDL